MVYSIPAETRLIIDQNATDEHASPLGLFYSRWHLSLQEAENWFSGGSSFWGYGIWWFRVLSHFLAILVLNFLFGKFFAKVDGQNGGNASKTFGWGLVYLLGLPLIAAYSLFTLFGLPFGILLLLGYVLSIWLGDCLAALLVCHFLNTRNEHSWNFWTIVMLSLGGVVILDLLLFFPVLGVVCYLLVLTFTFGTLAKMILTSSKFREIRTGVFALK